MTVVDRTFADPHGHICETLPHGQIGETAVLDIGGESGALIIYADGEMVGKEIEICRSGDLESRVHNVVRARRASSGLVYAAVFPTLSSGRYDVLRPNGTACQEATVSGGRVTEVDLVLGP